MPALLVLCLQLRTFCSFRSPRAVTRALLASWTFANYHYSFNLLISCLQSLIRSKIYNVSRSFSCLCFRPPLCQTSVPCDERSYCASCQRSRVHPEQTAGRGRSQTCWIWGKYITLLLNSQVNTNFKYEVCISSRFQNIRTLFLFLFPPVLHLTLLRLQSNCAQYAADRREEEKMCDHLISAAKHRDHVTANQLKQKILNILTNKHGAWGTMSQRWAAGQRRFWLHELTFFKIWT